MTPVAQQKGELALAIAMPPGAMRDAIASEVRELNARVAVEHENASDWAGLATAMERSGSSVLLFDLASLGEPELARSIAEVRARMPRVRVIAVYPYDEPAMILLAMRCGANEFVHSPVGPALSAALERAQTVFDLPSPGEHRGRIVGFVSAKGGCGATTLACHVAADLKRRGSAEVLLAEFDTTAGPLDFLMKTHGEYSLADGLENIGRLDANFWAALVSPSRTGVNVLSAPPKLAAELCAEERVEHVLRFLRTQHDWSVLDFGRGINPLLAAGAAELDELFVVTTIDLPSLHMAKSLFRNLTGSFEKTAVRLVLNRTQKVLDVSAEEVEKIFGRPVYATVPDDFEALYAAYANGGLAGPETALGTALGRLTARLTGEPAKNPRKKFFFW